MYELINTRLNHIKTHRPLIINITNWVTMEFVANGLLSLGASPIMTFAPQEVPDLMRYAQGVVINIGTLNDEFINLCHTVCALANQLNIPVTLDPVGAGASDYRTTRALELLDRYQFAIIRGNASEIAALSGAGGSTKGVDSSMTSNDAVENAALISSRYQTVIVISGAADIVVSQHKRECFDGGSPLMPMITGSGCLLSAVVSAFASVDAHYHEAAAAAVVFYGRCGELAAEIAQGPGTFKPCFLNALSTIPGY